jgi:aminoacrylate hydrolase
MMQYEVVGRTDAAAETVVLSSGLGGVGTFWKQQIADLSARYCVVLYDQRGTGRNKQDLPENYSISMMADDVIEVIDQLNLERCGFVGHALGGIVGLDLALRYPDRVSKLIAINAWSKADVHTGNCFAIRKQILLHVGPEAYLKAQPIFLFPAPWLSENAERMAKDETHGVSHFQGTDTVLKRIGALLAFDLSARLSEITVPTLVAASRDDILVPWTASKLLADGLPNARLWVTPEGGHGFPVTEPAIFNAAMLAFLAEPAA